MTTAWGKGKVHLTFSGRRRISSTAGHQPQGVRPTTKPAGSPEVAASNTNRHHEPGLNLRVSSVIRVYGRNLPQIAY